MWTYEFKTEKSEIVHEQHTQNKNGYYLTNGRMAIEDGREIAEKRGWQLIRVVERY